MMYPLEAPNGWFLLEARHEHTPIRFTTDTHEPVDTEGGPWFVNFQKYPKGGRATSGRGHTLEEAWKNASEKCVKVDLGEEID